MPNTLNGDSKESVPARRRGIYQQGLKIRSTKRGLCPLTENYANSHLAKHH
jgi:hypothetical protein